MSKWDLLKKWLEDEGFNYSPTTSAYIKAERFRIYASRVWFGGGPGSLDNAYWCGPCFRQRKAFVQRVDWEDPEFFARISSFLEAHYDCYDKLR